MRGRLLVFGALLALLIAQIARAATVTPTDKAAEIDRVMTLYHKYGEFNGTVLVAERGRIIYRKGFGLANFEWNIPNEPGTKFRIGSITKQFTAMLILQLVEQGSIKLEEKISAYLPEFRKDVGDRVTIHHLLTHTSGIPSYTSQPKFLEDVSRNPYDPASFIQRFASGDLRFEPGTQYSYNNSGYFLLGAIIEKVTGKPYEQALKEMILDPLGMVDTGYDHHETLIKGRASGYVLTINGVENAPYLDMSIPYAAGSMYSTAEDLYRWDQGLYTEKLLSHKYTALMFKPFLDNYAYGWEISDFPIPRLKKSVHLASHSGGIHGFSTYIVRALADKHLIVLLDNTSRGRYQRTIYPTILEILYDQPYTLPKPSIANELLSVIKSSSIGNAIKRYRQVKMAIPARFNLQEGELRGLGYMLSKAKRFPEAIEIFKLNVEAYPRSAGVYDDLGEAYIAIGDKALAIRNYEKVLELLPKDVDAESKLRVLRGQ